MDLSFFGRTLSISKVVAAIQEKTRKSIIRAWSDVNPSSIPELDFSNEVVLEQLYTKMLDCVDPRGGDLVARRNSVNLGKLYLHLDIAQKSIFFSMLSEKFGPDNSKLHEAISEYMQTESVASQQKLSLVSKSQRFKILRQFNGLDNGLQFLIQMRADVMQAMRIKPDLWPVESDLSEILSFWFDIGLLDMKMISWDSPASLLEKLIVYEAVHKISSWLDLRNRLDSDRRCFAFFHNKMPYDPLIFVEVALTDKVSSSIHDLLDETLPITTYDDINTAVFYSISNTQRGMVGISLGNFLIKQVVSELKREFPSIETFVTLSPIPGFIKWLMNHDKQRYYSDFYELTSSLPEYDESLLSVVLLYLSTTQNDKVVDPVAHFHLSNGASILSVNWEADKSSKGLKNSAGIMVNYKYELSKIDEYSAQYSSRGIINFSKKMRKLLDKYKDLKRI